MDQESPRKNRQEQWRGLSLLHIFSMLLLVAVLAGITIPAFFERTSVTLDNAATLLARDIRSAQNRAAYWGTGSRFEFDEDGLGYRVSSEAAKADPDSSETFIRRYDRDAVFEGVEISDIQFGPGRSVDFDPRGNASNGGQVTLAFRGEVRSILVEKVTGRIEIRGLARPWHDYGR